MDQAVSAESLPFAVFTNSQWDYRITVCSANLAPAMAAAVEAIARAVSRTRTRPVDVLVGATPCGSDGGQYLAFRVFDLGEYLGRPHTLGLVAVLVPALSQRSWRLSQILSCLELPRAGSPQYRLPSEAAIAAARAAGPVFERLDEWDRGQVHRAFICSDPAGFAMDWSGIVNANRPGGHSRLLRRLALAGLMLLLAAGSLSIWYLLTHEHPQGPGPTPSELQPRVPDKKVLVAVLDRSGIRDPSINGGSADPGALAAIVVDTSEQLQKWMTQLRQKIEPIPDADVVEAFVSETLKKWSPDRIQISMNILGPPDTIPDSARVQTAITIHDKYVKCRNIMNRMGEYTPGTSMFASQWKYLMSELATSQGASGTQPAAANVDDQ